MARDFYMHFDLSQGNAIEKMAFNVRDDFIFILILFKSFYKPFLLKDGKRKPNLLPLSHYFINCKNSLSGD